MVGGADVVFPASVARDRRLQAARTRGGAVVGPLRDVEHVLSQRAAVGRCRVIPAPLALDPALVPLAAADFVEHHRCPRRRRPNPAGRLVHWRDSIAHSLDRARLPTAPSLTTLRKTNHGPGAYVVGDNQNEIERQVTRRAHQRRRRRALLLAISPAHPGLAPLSPAR